MWIVIGTISFVTTYTTIYYLVLYFATDSSCSLAQNKWVHSISSCIERNLQYILWVYPVIWMFWPAEAFCHRSKKKHNA